jgi:peptidyl-prolyl cis-trans isomerase B (cyclophilin B)
MRRSFLAATLLLAGLAAAPAISPSAAALGPKFLLKVKAVEEKVRLGEKIPLEVTLYSANRRRTAVHPLEIGSPQGLVFYVKTARGSYQVSQLRGKYQGTEFKPDVRPLENLKGGKKMEETVELLAVLTGKLEITAVFLGVDRRSQPEPLEAKTVTVTVEPGEKGETRVGAVIRTDKGSMTVALEPEKAYNTVHNFLNLANQGFYTKRVFHRIIKEFMVQTGCPDGNGSGDPGYFIPAEFNSIKHEKGVLSMARRGGVDNSAGSQFFIMHAAKKGLDGQYSAFGRVVKGLEVVDALAEVPVERRPGDPPGEPPAHPLVVPKLLGIDMVLLK